MSSLTDPRTVLATTPIGMTDSAMTGSTMCRKLSIEKVNDVPPFGFMPSAGSQPSSTEKMITRTMASQ